MAVFWDVKPCDLAEIDLHLMSIYCQYHQCPDDEAVHLETSQLLQYYMAQHSRKQLSRLIRAPYRMQMYVGSL
jgi:hypothetical protein